MPRDQWEAIEADLLAAGYTMADLGERVSWRAVLNFAKNCSPESALYRAVHGADSAWNLETQLLALIADVLNIGNYQRGGGKGEKPKPLKRPGVTDKGTTHFGGEGVPMKDFDAIWAS